MTSGGGGGQVTIWGGGHVIGSGVVGGGGGGGHVIGGGGGHDATDVLLLSHFTHGAHTRFSLSIILALFLFMHAYMLRDFDPMFLIYIRAVVGKSAEYLFPKLQH